MSSARQYPYSAAARDRVSILAETVELLVEELAAIANRNWAELPALKKKKVVLASRMHAVDWRRVPADTESFDLRTLRKLVTELESLSRQKIQNQINLIGLQLLALQDQHLYWRECLNVKFEPFCDAIPVS